MSSNGLRSRGVVGIGRVGLQSGQETEPVVFRRILGEAFAIVADAIDTGDATPADVTSALDTCRAGVSAGLDAVVLDPLAATCFKSTRRFVALARGRTTEQRAQIGALVVMVQEAVATIAGSETSLHKTLIGSAERFERLARVGNIEEIHAQLFDEVSTLKRMAVERQAEWEQTFEEFGKRLTGLETQLDSTRREAAIDPLTNVANRRTFERTCREWMRPNRPRFVMAMTDVDDFKAINDRHGHAVGDRVLVTVAETLARSLRPEDLVARMGGDEFAILAATLTLQQAQGRFADIVNAVRIACRPLIPEETSLSLSIGIAEFSAGDTPESLQQRADVALYEAKRNGKGRLVAKASPFIRDLLKARRAPQPGR